MARSSIQVSDELRAELEQRNAEHGWEFHLQVTEAEAMDLASGCVPLTVQAQAHTMLNFMDCDRRNAERPVKKARRA